MGIRVICVEKIGSAGGNSKRGFLSFVTYDRLLGYQGSVFLIDYEDMIQA